jgi:carboxyl-terminal processing protease
VAATPTASSSATDPPATTAQGCRDWSTVDLAALPPLTQGRHARLLDQVWHRVLEKHYDPTLGCLPWDELRRTYARKVAQAATDDEAYAHIGAMLETLGQSHVRLFPPKRDASTVGPARCSLRVRWIEEQLVVVEGGADDPRGPVPVGAVLLAIDGRPTSSLVDELRGRTEPAAFPLEIAGTVAARLSCERAGMVHALELAGPGDDRPMTREVTCLAPEGERVTLGNLRDVPTRVEHRMLDQGVGLLAFNVWMLPMMERIEGAMAALRAQGMRALVLDLRGNPGGVGVMAVPVARLVLDRDASLGTLRFRDFVQELVVEQTEGGFTGPVAVLVDEGTASTSEIFVVGLRDLGRVTVVGARPSAGAALPSVIEQMHGGALLQYVVADHRSPRGTVVEGKGIEPDVRVTETRQAFAAGRDPVLDAAHHRLVGQLAGQPPDPGEELVPSVPPTGAPTQRPATEGDANAVPSEHGR